MFSEWLFSNMTPLRKHNTKCIQREASSGGRPMRVRVHLPPARTQVFADGRGKVFPPVDCGLVLVKWADLHLHLVTNSNVLPELCARHAEINTRAPCPATTKTNWDTKPIPNKLFTTNTLRAGVILSGSWGSPTRSRSAQSGHTWRFSGRWVHASSVPLLSCRAGGQSSS